jgi:hypothetical protein
MSRRPAGMVWKKRPGDGMRTGKYLGYVHGAPVRRRWRRCSRSTVESREAISINELHKAGAFGDHWVTFSNAGIWLPFSRLRACRQLMEIYAPRLGEMQRQPVPLQWTQCRLGYRIGWRPWFLCRCGRRAGKLYDTGAIFACRKCCNLIYECQLQSAKGRLKRTAEKIRLRLRVFRSTYGKLPPRPRGMRRKKYRELITKLAAIDGRIALKGQKRAIQRRKYQRG